MFASLLADRRARRAAKARVVALYGLVQEAARDPWLFGDGRAPDTVEGRFAALTLMMALTTRRLSAGEAEARAFSQALFDHMISDLDAAARELGVGDMSMAKTMKRLGERFYGQARAYDAALKEADHVALVSALSRNFRPEAMANPDPGFFDALGGHVRQLALRLDQASDEALIEAKVSLGR